VSYQPFLAAGEIGREKIRLLEVATDLVGRALRPAAIAITGDARLAPWLWFLQGFLQGCPGFRPLRPAAAGIAGLKGPTLTARLAFLQGSSRPTAPRLQVPFRLLAFWLA